MRRKTTRKSTYKTKGTGARKFTTLQDGTVIVEPRRNRGTPKLDLEKDTKRLAREVNARLNSLERSYKTGTWASKTLSKRLNTMKTKAWKGNRVKIKENLTKTQLTAIHKALSSFLNSKTSTKKGIKNVKSKQIENIKQRLSLDDDTPITDEEAEFFYDMFGDNDFNDLSEKIGASALQAAIEDAIEAGDSEDYFLQRLEWYGGVEMNDLDLREKAIRIYDKYVEGR